jgi:UDP-glucuronate decarboxylase
MSPNDGRVISNFIVQAIQGKDITIYGEGTQTRSFCYVSDLVEGIIRTLELKAPLNAPINIGNPGTLTMLELANLVVSLCKSTSKIIFMPLPSDDPQQRKPDISRAKSVLSWEPKIQIEEGLLKTIVYFKSIIK